MERLITCTHKYLRFHLVLLGSTDYDLIVARMATPSGVLPLQSYSVAPTVVALP